MVITSSVKSAILEACRYDGDADVRSTACSLIASIVSVHGVGAWPDCMHILANGLADTSLDVVDGSFKALKYVCEDGVDIYRQQLLAYRKDDAVIILIILKVYIVFVIRLYHHHHLYSLLILI